MPQAGVLGGQMAMLTSLLQMEKPLYRKKKKDKHTKFKINYKMCSQMFSFMK
jgi:hypothetical protein